MKVFGLSVGQRGVALRVWGTKGVWPWSGKDGCVFEWHTWECPGGTVGRVFEWDKWALLSGTDGRAFGWGTWPCL